MDNTYDDVLSLWEDESEEEQYLYQTNNNFDNEPLADNRVWESFVEDIDGGDNFADYCQYIFNTLDEMEYFDN